MMKKDLLNKQVVRAISLGLSAVMLTTPMTALAAEADDSVTGDVDKNIIKQNAADEQTEAYAGANEAIDTAQAETSEASVAVAVEALDDDVEDTVLTNEKKTAEEVAITYDDAKADEIGAQVEGAATDLEEADLALDVAEDAEARAKEIVEETINPTLDAVDDNNTVINEANEKADEAAKAADDAALKAKDAKTEEEVQAAIDEANAALEAAKEAQADAQEAYDENKKALEELEDDVQAAKDALAAAQAAVDTTEAELQEAVDKLAAAEAKAEALEDELAATEEALKSSKEAALQAAYEAMMAEAAKVGPDGLNPYNGEAGEEDYTSEFGTESAGGDYWKTSLEYFKLYIEYLYDGQTGVEYNWAKEGTAAAVEANTYTVTYTDENGEKVTKYYNYHLSDKTGEITIYEKIWGEKEVTKYREIDVTEDKLGTQNEDGTWTQYEATEGEVAVDDGDTKYVAKGEAVVEKTTLAENQEVVGETETTTTVDENGKIVVVTTATVETVTFDNPVDKCDVKAGYWSRSDARKAARKLMNKLAAEFKAAGMDITGDESNCYNGFFDIDDDWDPGNGGFYEYELRYKLYTKNVQTDTVVLETQTYDTTKYEKHTFVVGTDTEEYTEKEECWTERKDLSNDDVIEEAKEKIKELTDTITEKKEAAKAAEDAVEDAREAAEDAKEALEAVREDLNSTADEVAAAEKAYEDAKKELEDSEKILEDINEDVADAEEDYEDAVDELDRFEQEPSDDADDDNDDNDDYNAPYETPATTPETPAEGETTVTPSAPAETGTDAGQAVVDIEDEDTPLAAGIDNGDGNDNGNGGDDDVLVASAEDEDKVVAIEDEATPLAPGAAEKANMSWWWLLIIAILGATGYKMYKDHQKKKEEAQEA